MRAGKAADICHVDDVERRIGRRLEEEDLGVGADRLFPGLVVARVDDGVLDAEAAEHIVDNPAARAEGGPARNDMIAGRKLAEQGRRHRGHAGRLGAAGLGAFEQRDALLQHGSGRVLHARIDHAGLFAREARGHRLGIVVAIARVQEERLAGLTLIAAPGAAAHGLSGRLPAARDGAVLSCRSLHGGASRAF